VRMQAERALGQMRDARAVELLIAALRDENVHRSAQHALESIGAPSVEPLIAVLRDENEDVRGRAVEALGRIGDARAVEPLIAALRDGKGGFFAKYALEQIRAWPAVEPLIAALRDKNEDVRRNAAEALGEMDDGRAIVPLIAALRDENEDVRRSVEHVLGRMLGARALDELVQGDKKRTFWSSVRYEARKAAEKIRWRFE
jgi:HEAT repeat protein